MEAPPAKNRDQQPHHKGRKKQKHDKPKKPAKTRNDDGDGDDVPEAIQTVSKEMMEETSYYITPDGLRRVKPYFYTYHVFAKGRWFGKALVDILTSDYKTYTREYNEKAILAGRVKLNGKLVKLDAIVKEHQEITHVVHRHEPPVAAAPVKVVFQSEDMVVVDKPASVPVHPTGRYRHNTLIMILAKEHGLIDLHPVHRLDRLTSGLLLFARNAAAAEHVSNMIRSHQVQKTYLARVEGVFPHEHIEVDQPIRVVNFHLGVCAVAPDGKPSSTIVKRISTNGKSSLVMCLPKTGRTHQLRVHLAWLGYPIMHDPVYGSHPKAGIPRYNTNNNTVPPPVSVPAAAEAPLQEVQVEQKLTDGLLGEVLAEIAKESLEVAREEVATPVASAAHPAPAPAPSAQPPLKKSRTVEEGADEFCLECTESLPDPTPQELSLFLHALSYEGEGWKYTTEKPAWAADDYAL